MLKNKIIKCPRCAKESAIIDNRFGVLPGKKCQSEDAEFQVANAPQFYNLTKLHRIQRQRDQYDGDILQPWLPGKDQKPNPDFIKRNPDRAKDYFTDEQLKGL